MKNKMKKIIVFSTVAMFMLAASPAFSQTYKTVSDTAALNKEYLKVSSDIAELNVKINKAQSDLANDTKKSSEATADAQTTASATSDKASTATDGGVKAAKSAKREAKKSVKDAKNAKHAQDNVADQNKKLDKLNADLEKKQNRLKELDNMRASIGAPAQQ